MRWTFHLGDFVWYVFIQHFVVNVFCQILRTLHCRYQRKIIDINFYFACQMIVWVSNVASPLNVFNYFENELVFYHDGITTRFWKINSEYVQRSEFLFLIQSKLQNNLPSQWYERWCNDSIMRSLRNFFFTMNLMYSFCTYIYYKLSTTILSLYTFVNMYIVIYLVQVCVFQNLFYSSILTFLIFSAKKMYTGENDGY